MTALAQPRDPYPATDEEVVAFIFVYIELFVAHWDAWAQRIHPRDNPVPRTQFRYHRMNDQVLLWMLFQGHIELVGAPPSPEALRAGTPFSETSAFALTEAGTAFGGEFLCRTLLRPLLPGGPEAIAKDYEEACGWLWMGRLAPRYERDDRLFLWGQHEIKHFDQPAFNQELVLVAAEELNWITWMDDPLPRRPGRNPIERKAIPPKLPAAAPAGA